jgi:hypothetical protein
MLALGLAALLVNLFHLFTPSVQFLCLVASLGSPWGVIFHLGVLLPLLPVAAPPGFLAVCTLMINVCHNLGHGVTFIGAWAQDAFTPSAVLYMDDSDLFHMAIRMPLDEEFLQIIQSATNEWVGLSHAAGGLLKPQNCFWYMLRWIWKKGKARLKTLFELPQYPLYIPQLDKARVPL